MSHATEAKEAVQKVVALRLHRFGFGSDVFPHLNSALAHLDAIIAEETVQPEAVAAVEVAEPEVEVRVEESPLPAPTATVPEMLGDDSSVLATHAEPEAPPPKRRARRKGKSRSPAKS